MAGRHALPSRRARTTKPSSLNTRNRAGGTPDPVGRPEQTSTTALELLAEEFAQMVAAELWPQLERLVTDAGGPASPWLTTAQAISYTGLPEGTFRKLAACGKIPSHGGRSKIFYRPEIDQALLSSAGLTEDARRLRSVR